MPEGKDQLIKYAAIAGGVAAAAGIAYYLLREEQPSEAGKGGGAGDVGGQADRVLTILGEIQKSQDKMKTVMKDLTKELVDQDKDFKEVYDMVTKLQPEDPLEKYGMTMADFDALLDRTQYDTRVREAISSIMNQPDANPEQNANVSNITVQQLVEVHRFMLAELQTLVQKFTSMPDKSTYDVKTVTIAAQAMVGAKMQKQYNLSTDDVEAAVLNLHGQLATDREFATINIKMQQTMSQLMTGQGEPM